jgi:hypothetical protein
MEYITEGTLKTASKVETINTKNGPKQKRRFILETNDEYPQTLEFELFGDKVKLLEGLHSEDYVKVKFDIRGRVWIAPDGNKRVIMSLSPWYIEKVDLSAQQEEDEPDFGAITEKPEDLPF